MKHIRKHYLRTERWKDVKGYEGLYQVSNFGRVRSVDRYIEHERMGLILRKGKLLKLNLKKTGYYHVALCKNNIMKTFSVHRLVAEAFKPNPDNLPTVDHINRIRTDNRLENLRWAPWELQAKNSNREPQKNIIKEKYSKPVLQHTLDMIFIKEYPSVREAERQTGLYHSNIIKCCKGLKNYKSVGGYIWKYKELTDTL